MSASPPSASRSAWQAHWHRLAARERLLLQVAAVLVTLALLWWLALAPALQTLRQAPARHATLDAQLQTMQHLQAQAQALQNAPRLSPDAAGRALQAAVAEHLGPSARLSLQGGQATLTLQGTPAPALAAWLAQARANAYAVPQEARLVRSNRTDSTRWDGTLVLSLPQP